MPPRMVLDGLKDPDGAKRKDMNQVDILVSGKPVKQIAHNGKLFVVATPGQQYEVRVRNNSYSRIMAVASIDGLSVLSGEAAKEEGPGYVINGLGSYTIKGWRTSNEEVKAFEFSKKDKSYAAKSENGDPTNVGVIGVALWSEKVKPAPITVWNNYESLPYYRPRRFEPYWNEPHITYTCSANALQCTSMNMGSAQGSNSLASSQASYACDSSPAEFDLGTKFSDKTVADAVTSTEFEAAYVISKVEIFYASREQLEAMGVPVSQAKEVSFPQAFGGYCKPPRQ